MSFSKYSGSGATDKAIDKYLNKNSSPTKPVQGTTPSKEKQLGNYSTTTPKPTTTSNNKNLGNYSTPSKPSTPSGGNKSYVNPPPAVNKPASNQYQYANYDSNNKFLGYTTGESGKSNAMGNASYVIAPNGQKYNTGFTSSNQGSNNSNSNSSLSGYKNVAGWNDKNNTKLNTNYLPQGLTLPSDGNFSVGAHAIKGQDGNVLRDNNGNVMFEYRPNIYYDKDGKATFQSPNDIVINPGGRVNINSDAYGLKGNYGYDQQKVTGHETAMVEYKHPITGKWEKTSMGMAEGIWRNLVNGGYYSEADKANNFRIVEGEYGKALDLNNSNIDSANRQAQIEMSNKMYQDSPEGAVGFRLQQIDDYLRSEHFKKTGETVPVNYFIQNGEALKQLNTAGIDKNVLNKAISELSKAPSESQANVPQVNVTQPIVSNTFNQNDYLLQAQREYDTYMKEQSIKLAQQQAEYDAYMIEHSAKLAQQQAEYEALMKQYEVNKNEQINQNKYLESELNSYNGSNQDSTYKSTITEDARINAISKYLRELEMANQKK